MCDARSDGSRIGPLQFQFLVATPFALPDLSCPKSMPVPPIVPKGDALRRAIAWLSEQDAWTPSLIEQACQRFDVTPADEEFLLREFRSRQARRKN